MASRMLAPQAPSATYNPRCPDLARLVVTMSTLETDPQRSALMSQVRQKDTGPERIVRHILNRMGIGFRTNAKDLPGTPDIVNRRESWAIFVHGCFWHAHEDCPRWTIPKRNREFWQRKFAANRERDRHRQAELEWLGYRVMVIWECELNDEAALTSRLRELTDGHTRRFGDQAVAESAGRYLEATANRISYRYTDSRRRVVRTIHWHDRDLTSRLVVPQTAFESMPPEWAYEQAWLRRSKHPPTTVAGPTIHCADVFSGCGGLSLGISEACRALQLTFDPCFALDFDPTSLEVYGRNFGPRVARCADINQVLPGAVDGVASPCESDLQREIGPVDMLVAGPPCQGHSNLNNHTRRDDRRNDLYQRVGRFAELFLPTHVLIENVAAVILDGRRAMYSTADHLRSLGYALDHGVVDLARLGVPQSRKRHVVVASRAGTPDLQQMLARHHSEPARTLRWAIEDIQDEPPTGIFSSPANLSAENYRRIDWLFDHDQQDLPNMERPLCHRSEHKYLSMYGRLYWDRPANTLTTGFHSPGQGRYVHPSRRRTLTPHEAARLQMFPDWFDFSPATTRMALSGMIGNAVPMRLGFVLGLELLALGH